jgi:hypothetical protein
MYSKLKGGISRPHWGFKFFIYGMLASTSILFLSFVGTPAVYSFPRDLAKLKGNIKFLFIYDNEIKKDGGGQHTFVLSSKTFVSFDKAGASILSEAFWPKGRINEYMCRYDRKGNLVEMNSADLIADNWIHSTLYRHRYDTQGRVIESITYANDGIEPPSTSYKYLRHKEQVVEYIKDKNFYLKPKIDTQHYSVVDRDFSKFNYRRKIEYKAIDTVIEKNFKKINFYNKNMDIVKTYTYQPIDSLMFTGFFEYDTNNYLIQSTTYQKGTLVHKTNHSYIYDNIGNWTTDSVFDQGTLSHVVIRKFEYY